MLFTQPSPDDLSSLRFLDADIQGYSKLRRPLPNQIYITLTVTDGHSKKSNLFKEGLPKNHEVEVFHRLKIVFFQKSYLCWRKGFWVFANCAHLPLHISSL